MLIEIIGYLAGIIWVTQTIPQIYKVYKTKEAKSLSYISLIMVIICSILRVIYWFAKEASPVYVANWIFWFFMITLLILKLKYDKRWN